MFNKELKERITELESIIGELPITYKGCTVEIKLISRFVHWTASSFVPSIITDDKKYDVPGIYFSYKEALKAAKEHIDGRKERVECNYEVGKFIYTREHGAGYVVNTFNDDDGRKICVVLYGQSDYVCCAEEDMIK